MNLKRILPFAAIPALLAWYLMLPAAPKGSGLSNPDYDVEEVSSHAPAEGGFASAKSLNPNANQAASPSTPLSGIEHIHVLNKEPARDLFTTASSEIADGELAADGGSHSSTAENKMGSMPTGHGSSPIASENLRRAGFVSLGSAGLGMSRHRIVGPETAPFSQASDHGGSADDLSIILPSDLDPILPTTEVAETKQDIYQGFMENPKDGQFSESGESTDISQFALNPPSSHGENQVPDNGATLMLAGGVLVGLAWYRRRCV